MQALLDPAPADQRDLGALTRALERRFGQRAIGSHSRELLNRRRHQEGERFGAYAADLQLYAQRGYPGIPAAALQPFNTTFTAEVNSQLFPTYLYPCQAHSYVH